MLRHFSDCSATKTASTIFFLVIFAGLPVLGAAAFYGSSEAREAHVAQVIRMSGEWLLPTRNGLLPSKPILFHWIVAFVSFLTGSVTEFTARLPSLLFGAAAAAMLSVYVRKIAAILGCSEDDRQQMSVLAPFMALTTYGFLNQILTSMVDVTFGFFAVFAILVAYDLLLNAAQGDTRSHRWTLFYLLCGLAVLAKGPLGLLLPLLFASILSFFLSGFWSTVRGFLKPRFGWLIFLLVALPWYLAAYQRGSDAFVQRQIIFENLRRFLGGDNVNYQPWWFYIESIFTRGFPWIFIALLLARKSWNYPVERTRKFLRALIVAGLAALLFFSCSSGKRHSYLLPLYPLLALYCAFAAVLLKPLWAKALWLPITWRMMLYRLAKVTIAVTLAVGIAAVLPWPWFGPEFMAHAVAQHAWMLFTLPVLSAAVFAFLDAGDDPWPRYRTVPAVLCILSSFFCVLMAIDTVRAASKNYSARASAISARAGIQPIVAIRDRYDELLDPVFFYLQRPVSIVEPQTLVPGSLHPGVLYIARRSVSDPLPNAIKGTCRRSMRLAEATAKNREDPDREIAVVQCPAA